MRIVDAHRYRPCKYEGISPPVGLDIPSNLGHIYGKSLNSEGFPYARGGGGGGRSTGSFSKGIRDSGLILSGCNLIGSYVINILPRFGYGGWSQRAVEVETYLYFF